MRAKVVFLLTFCCFGLAANDDSDIFNYSLEELMQVTIASKSSETVIQAPGVITLVSRQDIESNGARHLKDILDRLVNTQVIGSNLYPQNRLSVRGVTQTHTDNKVLFLLNGHVVRDANQGGINADLYQFIPAAIIDKVELIRGPGSALYGTNAFSGVLNVVTRHGPETESNSIQLSLGSFNTHAITGQYGWRGEDNSINVALHSIDSDGDNFENLNGEFGSNGDYRTHKQGSQLYIDAAADNFTLNTFFSKTKQGNIKSLFQFPASNLSIERHHLNLGHAFNSENEWQISTNFTYNFHEVGFDISNSRKTQTDSQDYLIELNIGKQISSNLHILLGSTYEKLSGTIGNISINPTHFNTNRHGLYIQGQWQIDEQQSIVYGGQYNKAEFSGGNVSPRIAYVKRLTDHWHFKLLYGEAFRSAFATDMFLNSPSLRGNPDLEPETIATYDFQLLYNSKHLNFSTTVYKSRHKKLHKRVVIEETPTFTNSGSIDYQGIELELKALVWERGEFILNASYQSNEDELDINDTTYNPNLMVKAGLNYSFKNGIKLGVFNRYFGEPTKPESLGIEPASLNELPSDYHHVSLNLVYPFTLNSALANNKPHTLGLYVDNLLNETIYFPSINRIAVNSMPHHNGLNAELRLTLNF